MDTRAVIDRFLAGHRIAFVGVSQNPEDFSRAVFKELTRAGYDVIPVNPGIKSVDSRTAYARVQDIPGPLDGAIVMTSPKVAEQIARDCKEARVPIVWLHRGVGQGAVSAEAVNYCNAHGIDVVPGECPLMFLGGSVHDLHRGMRKLTGAFPLAGAAQHASEQVTKWMLAALVALELLVAVGALYGGGSMLLDPTGARLGLPPPDAMPGLRFASYLVPGLVLVLANCALPLAVAVSALLGRRWANDGHALAGLVLTGFIAVEVLMLGWIDALQPIMLAFGIAIFALGSLFRARREHALREHAPQEHTHLAVVP